MIEAINCSKNFDSKVVLDGISFKVKKGSVFGYLGPNGAGKTTTIRIALGLMKPVTGSIFVFGQDAGRNNQLRENIGVLTESSGLYSNLTAADNLNYYGRLYGVENLNQKAANLLKFVGLNTVDDQKVGTFSTGMKRKLALAKSIINDPQVLFLDEPTAGLDPEAQKMVRELIMDLAGNNEITVFMTSHNLDEVQKVCDHICIINKGKIVANDNLDRLKKKYSKSVFTVELVSEAMARKAQLFLKEKGIGSGYKIRGIKVDIFEAPAATQNIVRVLVQNNIEVTQAYQQSRSLEEIYLELVNQ